MNLHVGMSVHVDSLKIELHVLYISLITISQLQILHVTFLFQDDKT